VKEEIAQFKQYLKCRYGNRSTPKHYVNDLMHFANYSKDKPVNHISIQDVDGFVTVQVQRGLKATTVNRRLASLHGFFEFLASHDPDGAPANPVIWRRHKVKEGHPLPRDIPDSQVEALFAAIADERDQAIFGLMVGAGLRIGEVASLRLEDLEAPPAPTQMARLRVCGKGEKERIVWLTPTWYQLVMQWVVVRPTVAHEALFLNRRGEPLSVRGIQHRLQTHCQQAGIYLSPHQLRHTFSRRLAEQRMPVESISKLLGHAQIETTQRYTAGADPDLRDEFRRAMDSVSTATPPAVAALPPVPVPTPAPQAADPDRLALILRRFDPFPAWLCTPLRAYVAHRWRSWQPHMAAQHAARLTRRLRVTWEWLLQASLLPDLSALQRTHVEAFLTARTQAGLSTNTICNDLVALRSFLFFVQERGTRLSPNIFRIPFPKRPHPLPRHLTTAAFQRLVRTVLLQTEADTAQNRLDRAWFLTLVHTGMRISELLNLRLSDLDLASGRLFIRQGKNGYGRVVYTTAQLHRALLVYLPHRSHLADNHLWLGQQTPLSANLVRNRLHRWGKEEDIDVSPHMLRHTLATLLVNQGMPIESLRKLLGHRTLSVTQQYARLSDAVVQQHFQQAIEGIEGIAASEWPLPSSIINVQVVHN
jgi:site-specific recombinase XerD